MIKENQRKKTIQSVFAVKNKFFLTPHYIRVFFEATEKQLELFKNVVIGDHNRIFIPPSGMDVIYFHPDNDNISIEHTPIKRTYTTRNIDFVNKEIVIDFVAHGDNGPASAWAINAKPGDVLGIGMKESSKPIIPDASNYLLVGDHTALPVVSTIVEQLSADKQVKVILEVPGKEDEIILLSEAQVEVTWIHNAHPEKGSELYQEVINNELLESSENCVAFVAAEYSSVKEIRNYLKKEKKWFKENLRTYAYWKAGYSEEQSARERHPSNNN